MRMFNKNSQIVQSKNSHILLFGLFVRKRVYFSIRDVYRFRIQIFFDVSLMFFVLL